MQSRTNVWGYTLAPSSLRSRLPQSYFSVVIAADEERLHFRELSCWALIDRQISGLLRQFLQAVENFHLGKLFLNFRVKLFQYLS